MRCPGRRGHAVLAATLALTAGLAGCGKDPVEVQVEFEVIETAEFAPTLGIDLSQMTELPSGVYIRDDVVGAGPGTYARGDTATINYTGWLRDGTQFDTGTLTWPSTQARALIQGFELGLEGTAVGGTRFMIIPPEQAYGPNRVGVIYPGAIVIFEVELVSVS